jgi:hypothetical protein
MKLPQTRSDAKLSESHSAMKLPHSRSAMKLQQSGSQASRGRLLPHPGGACNAVQTIAPCIAMSSLCTPGKLEAIAAAIASFEAIKQQQKVSNPWLDALPAEAARKWRILNMYQV